ncbi:MAG TPA: hypothetical protein VIF09_17455 [Polyangiaceae bacterium]|jgi:hypothetical protein
MEQDSPQKPEGGAFDVVMLAGKTEDGGGTKVVRARPGRVEAGEVRPVKDGQPIVAGEMVHLEPRKDAPALFDVHVVHEAKPTGAKTVHHGPAQVATDDYRDSWERTFGPRDSRLN